MDKTISWTWKALLQFGSCMCISRVASTWKLVNIILTCWLHSVTFLDHGPPHGCSTWRPADPQHADPRGFLVFRRTQEGCGGLEGKNPAAFPQARPIFQQPFSLPESAQTLASIAFRAAGKSGNHFPAAPKFAGKPFQQGISDTHSLLEFSDVWFSQQCAC